MGTLNKTQLKERGWTDGLIRRLYRQHAGRRLIAPALSQNRLRGASSITDKGS